MMFEEDFAHTDSGLIKFNKIKIDNDAIPQAKVASLTTDLGAKAKLTVSRPHQLALQQAICSLTRPRRRTS